MDINIKNIDIKKRAKAQFILKCKGKDLSTAVREMIDTLAKEYDKKNSK